MSMLLVEDPVGTAEATVGGFPLAPPGTLWPACRTCGKHMQFLAQLPLRNAASALPVLDGKVLLLFQCQNQPGMCDEWEPDSGGNAAVLVSASGRQPLEVPQGETLLPSESRIAFVAYDDSSSQDAPDDAYCASVDKDLRTIGKMGGVPLWLQGDETPRCACGETMVFVAQLESRGGGGINFGDSGSGYAFVCGSCAASAKFLWQCT